jgi:uncharacterized protein (TIGR03000 family)
MLPTLAAALLGAALTPALSSAQYQQHVRPPGVGPIVQPKYGAFGPAEKNYYSTYDPLGYNYTLNRYDYNSHLAPYRYNHRWDGGVYVGGPYYGYAYGTAPVYVPLDLAPVGGNDVYTQAYMPPYTTVNYVPGAYAPAPYTPVAYVPAAYAPAAYNPAVYVPAQYTPVAYTPAVYAPMTYTPPAYAPQGYAPPAQNWVGYKPDTQVTTRTGDTTAKTNGSTASVELMVPTANAEVWFDGVKMPQTGTKRQFKTPDLTPGKFYTYEVRVRWSEGGEPIEQTRTVTVQSGRQAILAFFAEKAKQEEPKD